MSRRSPRSQLQALKRGQFGKQKEKDYDRWMGQFPTRQEVDQMIRFYIGQYDELLRGKQEAETQNDGAPDAGV